MQIEMSTDEARTLMAILDMLRDDMMDNAKRVENGYAVQFPLLSLRSVSEVLRIVSIRIYGALKLDEAINRETGEQGAKNDD